MAPRSVLFAIRTDRLEHLLTVTAATFIVVCIIITFQRCADKPSISAATCVITAYTLFHPIRQCLPLPILIEISAVSWRFIPNITRLLWKAYISVASPSVEKAVAGIADVCLCIILVDNRARWKLSGASIIGVSAATCRCSRSAQWFKVSDTSHIIIQSHTLGALAVWSALGPNCSVQSLSYQWLWVCVVVEGNHYYTVIIRHQ